MRQITCPIDGKPCEQDCPDRYIDQPEGGCWLTTAIELGGHIISIDEHGRVACAFTPRGSKGVS